MRSHQQATYEDVAAEIGEAVNFVVHVERQPGRRAIREVLRLDGYDRQAQEFRFEMVFGGADSFIKGDHNRLETRIQSHSKDHAAEIADTASSFVQRM
jgi:pilus assembly protein CpaF